MSRNSEKDLVALFEEKTQEPDRFDTIFDADKREQQSLIRHTNRRFAQKNALKRK